MENDKGAKEKKQKKSAGGNWIGYRPEIKVVDCTIRDGGLMNNHAFDEKLVKDEEIIWK